MSDDQPTLLFTAFEPSGDAHAAPVIAQMVKTRPDVRVIALGGPAMASAGAALLEDTTARPAMLTGAFSKVAHHLAINKRLRAYLRDHRVDLHIPVDSPAANFPLCRITRKAGAKIVHLVAPQLWAWAPWRIGKLRRRTDHVLCLLPFEESYFNSRHVPATFIGHPVIHNGLVRRAAQPMPHGRNDQSPLHLVVLPGSRSAEIHHNLPSMLRMVSSIRTTTCPDLAVTVVLANRRAQEEAHRVIDPATHEGVQFTVGHLDEALDRADVALACSGTASLDLAGAGVPMVIMYRTNPWPWFTIGFWLIRTPYRALPNVIENKRIVPEFIPHFGSDAPIQSALADLLIDPDKRCVQQQHFATMIDRFGDHDPAVRAARVINRFLPSPAGA